MGLDRGGFDGAIIIHKRFDHFDLDLPDATALQQTQAVIKKYPNVTLSSPSSPSSPKKGWSQLDSRNEYIKLANQLNYDWLMVIDSDEYVAPNADWKTFREQLEFVVSLGLYDQIFDIQFEGSISESGPKPRLFFLRPGNITYWQRHFWFVLEKKMICLKGVGDAGRMIKGIYLLHGKAVRSAKYYEASVDYETWQNNHELAIS